MRRLAITLIAASVIAVGLAGCGSNQNSGTSSAIQPVGKREQLGVAVGQHHCIRGRLAD